jgi:hypothetical protein
MSINKSTVTLSDDSFAIGIHAAVGGKSSTTELLEHNVEGKTEEKASRVETTIVNVEQHAAGTKLVNRLRALLPKYATCVEPLGYMTDPERLNNFNREVSEIEEEIRVHNAIPGQTARIKFDVLALPVGRILDEKTQHRLCDAVTEALTEGKEMLIKGEIDDLQQHLNHRKNIAGLMPPIVGRVVQSAMEQLREERKLVAKLVKSGRTPTEAGAQAKFDLVDDALVWVSKSLTGITADDGQIQSVQ